MKTDPMKQLPLEYLSLQATVSCNLDSVPSSGLQYQAHVWGTGLHAYKTPGHINEKF